VITYLHGLGCIGSSFGGRRGTLLYSTPKSVMLSQYAIFANRLQLLLCPRSRVINSERTLRTEELSRDVQGLTSHNDDLLTIEQLLSHSRGQTTKEVALAIDRDLFKHHNQYPSFQ
jgi:hypothetical protein